MKRREFIKRYADTVAAGRKRNFPDIRPSEAAVERMSDEKSAARQWRRYRLAWRTEAELERILAEPAPKG